MGVGLTVGVASGAGAQGLSNANTAGAVRLAGVAAGPDGSVYESDSGNGIVYRVAPGKKKPVVLASGLVSPGDLAADGSGDVYVLVGPADGMDIDEISPTGQITSLFALSIIFGGTTPTITGFTSMPNGTLYLSSYNSDSGSSVYALSNSGATVTQLVTTPSYVGWPIYGLSALDNTTVYATNQEGIGSFANGAFTLGVLNADNLINYHGYHVDENVAVGSRAVAVNTGWGKVGKSHDWVILRIGAGDGSKPRTVKVPCPKNAQGANIGADLAVHGRVVYYVVPGLNKLAKITPKGIRYIGKLV